MLRIIKITALFLSGISLSGCASLGIGHNHYYCDEQPNSCSNASTWLQNSSQSGNSATTRAANSTPVVKQQSVLESVPKVTQVAEVKPNLVVIKEQANLPVLDSRYLKVWLAPVVIQGEALTSKVLIVPFVH